MYNVYLLCWGPGRLRVCMNFKNPLIRMGLSERVNLKKNHPGFAKCHWVTPSEKGNHGNCCGDIWKYASHYHLQGRVCGSHQLPGLVENCWASRYGQTKHLPVIRLSWGKSGTQRIEICGLRLGGRTRKLIKFLSRDSIKESRWVWPWTA